MVEIRQMQPDDLSAVAALTNAAFAALYGAPAEVNAEPMFPALFFETRLTADSAGCFVATDGHGLQRPSGALLSVARGTLGWFGPLAVDPSSQRAGLGAALVARCVDSWHTRGVKLMGLETPGESAFHVRFYGGFGFRPAWTGVTLIKNLVPTDMPAGATVNGEVPDLDFIYPGLDLDAEAAATRECGAGAAVTDGEGFAIVHLRPTFQGAGDAFVPFAAARTSRSFQRVIEGAEHLASAADLTSLVLRVPGSAFATMDSLRDLGYRAASVMVRMKLGDNLDYDRGHVFYADNWL